MVKAVIIEDSELARLELSTMLKQYTEVEVIDEADSVESAVMAIEQGQPDLVFMDIDIIGGNAFDVLEQLTHVPALIFTTAFEQHALAAFNFNTVDYLLKPVNKERLAAAMQKFTQKIDVTDTTPAFAPDNRIFIKDGEQCWLVKVADIQYIEAVGNYSRVYFDNHSPMVYRSLNKVEERLSAARFLRANRQQLINLDYVTEIEPWNTGSFLLSLSNGRKIEVSRRQATKLKQMISL
ncbi:LytR/AlgR family response regulator transcription factor [Flocculibacter collagenilyticus]|uniref:LytR/AlgR family response regulator transcription factor n=1 Tax=Flocculibacter collagenilyticus TaxID=2744479 RepID=UPI0018F56F69|nr:LytTR family DNA-binding domain-containing protein [Flocculibacter collagenilyticus]